MGDALDIPQAHGEHRLGAVQGLNLALLIDTEYQGVVRWVRVKAGDVTHLFDEKGSVESLKLRLRCGCTAKALDSRCTSILKCRCREWPDEHSNACLWRAGGIGYVSARRQFSHRQCYANMKQRTLAMMTGFERYTKKTKHALFLDAMEQVVPWLDLGALIEPYYPKGQWTAAGGDGADAADIFSAAVVQLVGPGGWRRRSTARRCCGSS
jgi:hypothetical protein